jgi:hypothetical protein
LFAGFASGEEKALDSAKEQVTAISQNVESVLQNTYSNESTQVSKKGCELVSVH